MWKERQGTALRKQLSYEERRALCAELMRPDDVSSSDAIEVFAPATAEQIVRMLSNATPEVKEAFRALLGCEGACSMETSRASCYGRRLSKIEEDRLRANTSDAIDIPSVAGAGGVQVVNVPAYGVSYYLTEFSMDGEMSLATGSLNRVNVTVSHAGIPLATFRVSQFYKASCCTTIADAFRRHNLCLGWESTLQITVTNNNLLAGEAFINGVFSFSRGYPDPITGF